MSAEVRLTGRSEMALWSRVYSAVLVALAAQPVASERMQTQPLTWERLRGRAAAEADEAVRTVRSRYG